MTIPKSYTKGQRQLEAILNKLGFQTVLEYQVGAYSLDIYVPELKMAFEYDGPWHGLMKKHDAFRDEWLLKYEGIPVIRITEEDLKGNIEEMLVREIERHGDLRG